MVGMLVRVEFGVVKSRVRWLSSLGWKMRERLWEE